MDSPPPTPAADPIPRDYTHWRRCIEVDCRIALTAEFIGSRQVELANLADYRTQQFIRLYGEGHRQNVLGWFVRSAAELGSAP